MRATRPHACSRSPAGCSSSTSYLADGRRHIAGFMYAGNFLGISVDDKHAFSAEALEASQLCCFAHEFFDDFIDAHPAMEHELYCMAAHELAVAQQQLVLLGRRLQPSASRPSCCFGQSSRKRQAAKKQAS